MSPMSEPPRFQVNLELTGELRDRYRQAMARLRRERADLMRIMIEDWLRAFESDEPIRPLQPIQDPSPPGRPKSGEKKHVER